jgi:hypothetical protein
VLVVQVMAVLVDQVVEVGQDLEFHQVVLVIHLLLVLLKVVLVVMLYLQLILVMQEQLVVVVEQPELVYLVLDQTQVH